MAFNKPSVKPNLSRNETTELIMKTTRKYVQYICARYRRKIGIVLHDRPSHYYRGEAVQKKCNKHRNANRNSEPAINLLLNQPPCSSYGKKDVLESSLCEQQFSSCHLTCLACCVIFLQNRMPPVTLKPFDTRPDCHLPLLDAKPLADSHT